VPYCLHYDGHMTTVNSRCSAY